MLNFVFEVLIWLEKISLVPFLFFKILFSYHVTYRSTQLFWSILKKSVFQHCHLYTGRSKTSTFPFLIKQIQITFDPENQNLNCCKKQKALFNYEKESITGVVIIRSKNGPDSRKKSKILFLKKCGYLMGPLSKGL